MIHKLKPTKSMWRYYGDDGTAITADLVCSSIADKLAGYHISYSATELLKDLKLLTPKGKVNRDGLKALSHHLHERYHRGRDGVIIVNPNEGVKSE